MRDSSMLIKPCVPNLPSDILKKCALCLKPTILLSQQIVKLLFQLDNSIKSDSHHQGEVTLPFVRSSGTFLFQSHSRKMTFC